MYSLNNKNDFWKPAGGSLQNKSVVCVCTYFSTIEQGSISLCTIRDALPIFIFLIESAQQKKWCRDAYIHINYLNVRRYVCMSLKEGRCPTKTGVQSRLQFAIVCAFRYIFLFFSLSLIGERAISKPRALFAGSGRWF